jgi:hypothetical protein
MRIDIADAFLAQPEKSWRVFAVDRIGTQTIHDDNDYEASGGSCLSGYAWRLSARHWRAECRYSPPVPEQQENSSFFALSMFAGLYFPFSIFHLSFVILSNFDS